MLAVRGITIGAHIAALGAVGDRAFDPLGETPERLQELRRHRLPVLDRSREALMENEIMTARSEQDSVGGIVEVMAVGLPAGIGDPFFDSLESRLAHAVFPYRLLKGWSSARGFVWRSYGAARLTTR